MNEPEEAYQLNNYKRPKVNVVQEKLDINSKTLALLWCFIQKQDGSYTILSELLNKSLVPFHVNEKNETSEEMKIFNCYLLADVFQIRIMYCFFILFSLFFQLDFI